MYQRPLPAGFHFRTRAGQSIAICGEAQGERAGVETLAPVMPEAFMTSGSGFRQARLQ